MLCSVFLALGVSHAAERVEVVKIPGASNVMKAQRGVDGTIHVVFDAAGGPQYVKSTDGGKTFSAPLALVEPSSHALTPATRRSGVRYPNCVFCVKSI